MHHRPHNTDGFRPRLVPLTWLVLLLLTQFVLPALLLLGPRPARAGWQMYSAVPPQITLSLVTSSGAVEPLELADYVGSARGDLRLEGVLPAFVCQRHPEATAVRLQVGERPVEEQRCR
ncbi:MAG: hypothetical protein OHK0015_45800 [Chloroflexi bacterium OHK40]